MKPFIAFAFSLVMAATAVTAATADETVVERWKAAPETVFDAAEATLDDFKWIARPIIVFADSPEDPAFQEQMALLVERVGQLVERDVVILVDTDPSMNSALRKTLRPRGFMLTLVGKDGRVVMRKPFPWHVREITRSIDKQPIRRQELRDQ